LYEYADLNGNTTNANVYYPSLRDTIQYTYNTTRNPLSGYRANISYIAKIGSGTWETGYQFRYDDQDGNYLYQTKLLHTNEYITDPEFTSDVSTRNEIHSVYSQYGNKWKTLEYTGGLRYEYATRNLRFKNDPKGRALNLSNLFPSASILYGLENRWKLKGGYNRRIKRTNNFELNPFPEREHSETLEQGDPDLLPEYIDLSELGLIKELKGGSAFVTFYNQQVKNPIQRVNDVYNDTILKRVFTNAGKAVLWGAEGGITTKPVKWWQLYVGANVYHYNIMGALFGGTIPVQNKSWVYSVNATTTFQLTQTLNWQWSVNYLSKRATAQGEDSRFLSPNTSVKKTFWKGRLTATAQWQNIDLGFLNANQQRISTWGKNFYTTTNYVYETDVFLLNLSLNLNQLTRKLKLPASEFGEREF
jgi:outer membrane receptor protein involved in Fe transport